EPNTSTMLKNPGCIHIDPSIRGVVEVSGLQLIQRSILFEDISVGSTFLVMEGSYTYLFGNRSIGFICICIRSVTASAVLVSHRYRRKSRSTPSRYTLEVRFFVVLGQRS